MSSTSEYSDTQITAAMRAALMARDLPRVVRLLKMLALQNPHEAEVLLIGFELVLDMDAS